MSHEALYIVGAAHHIVYNAHHTQCHIVRSFSLEWRMDDFVEEVWRHRRTANYWDGKVHFNLNRVAF